MNIIVLPIIVAVILSSIIGVYSMTSQSEYNIADTAMDSMVQLNEKKNESLAAFVQNNTLHLDNHGLKQSEVYLIDFVLDNGTKKRVMYSQQGSQYDGETVTVEKRLDDTLTPLVNTGTGLQINLQDDNYNLNPAEIQSASITTIQGNKFLVDLSSSRISGYNGTNHGTGTGDNNATAVINGMGFQTRIIQIENQGEIIHGSGMLGKVDSLKPYLKVDSDTNFAATVLRGDDIISLDIKEFWKKYNYDGVDSLNEIIPLNTFGHADSKSMVGSNTISTTENGITLSGTGIRIIKLNSYSNDVLLNGTLNNTDIKIVTSHLDLTGLSIVNGPFIDVDESYVISKVTPTNTEQSHTCVIMKNPPYRNYSGTHYRLCSPGMMFGVTSNPNILVDNNADLNGFYYGQYTCYHSGLVLCHYEGYLEHTIPCDLDCSTDHTHSEQDHYISTLNTTNTDDGIKITKQFNKFIADGKNHKKYHIITAKHPWTEKYHFTEDFEQLTSFPKNSYMIVKLNGSSATISDITPFNQFLQVENIPANTPYKIIVDGKSVIAGVTDGNRILINNSLVNHESTVSGVLKLYPDSLTYRDSFSTVVFDNLHDETIHIPTKEDKVYVVHAYGKIPIPSAITVTNLNLDGTLPLSYLNGKYESGDAIHVPVIPKYKTIHLTINGLATSLNYADILGNTGIKVAEPSSNTVSKSTPTTTISSISATTGTSAFAIATTDGKMNAILTEIISGSATIKNSYVLQKIPPPPPPPPRPRDPLHGFVDIYINGDWIKKVDLGTDPNPTFKGLAYKSRNTEIKSVSYSYGDYTLSKAVSVNVKTGDFVEFYLYGQITGEINDRYKVPNKYILVSKYGSASATAIIKSAHIQIG